MAFRFLWRHHTQSPVPQQSLITSFWPGVPHDIDAALETQASDRVFLFKGTFSVCPPGRAGPGRARGSFDLFCFLCADRQVWAFRGYDLVAGYPKSISSFGLPRTVTKVDAALSDDEAGTVLFFVDRMLYRCEASAQEVLSVSWVEVRR